MSALIRWTGAPLSATARQLQRFGPQAERVVDLMRSISLFSDDATDLAHDMSMGVPNLAAFTPLGAAEQSIFQNNYENAIDTVGRLAAQINPPRSRYVDQVYNDAYDLADSVKRPKLSQTLADAGMAEVVGDYLLNVGPEAYGTLTNPLATARSFDVIRGNMLNQPAKRFMENVFTLRNLNQVNTPADIRAIRDYSQQNPDLQQMAMDLLATGRFTNIGDALRQAIGIYRDMGYQV